MFCMRCNHDIGNCICPDRDERLKVLSQHPNIGLTFCPACGEYQTRCKCGSKEPLEVRSAEGIIAQRERPKSTPTGRSSTNDPNLQNIPIRTPEGQRIRESFVAPQRVCRLERWSMVADGDPYRAPEDQRCRLQGDVYGHPAFQDGQFVISSVIMGMDGDYVRTQSGSNYMLGEVDPEYERLYPGAKERCLKRFREAS